MLKEEPAEVLSGLHGGCEKKRSLGDSGFGDRILGMIKEPCFEFAFDHVALEMS